MAHAYLNSPGAEPFPVLIDLRTDRKSLNALEYGTKEWLGRYIEAQYGKAGKSLFAVPPSDSRPFCVILDSLDEVLAGRSFGDVRSILERYLFNASAVVLCRSHFYNQYLQYLPFVTDREIVSLVEWNSDNILGYIPRSTRRYGQPITTDHQLHLLSGCKAPRHYRNSACADQAEHGTGHV